MKTHKLNVVTLTTQEAQKIEGGSIQQIISSVLDYFGWAWQHYL